MAFAVGKLLSLRPNGRPVARLSGVLLPAAVTSLICTLGLRRIVRRGHRAGRHVREWRSRDNLSVCESKQDEPFRTLSIPPVLYVFNAASLVKPGAIEKLTAEFIGYKVDVGIISESHLKLKHPDSCVAIDGYTLFRRDRVGRKGGGVCIYVRREMAYANVFHPPISIDNTNFELLWIKVNHGFDVTFVGALYHPPKPI